MSKRQFSSWERLLVQAIKGHDHFVHRNGCRWLDDTGTIVNFLSLTETGFELRRWSLHTPVPFLIEDVRVLSVGDVAQLDPPDTRCMAISWHVLDLAAKSMVSKD